jgi:uncharacterized protein YgiM (DUF1202 family)
MKNISFLLAFFLTLSSCFYSGPSTAFVLANGISLMSDHSGKLDWVETLNVGDKLTVLGATKTFGSGESARLYDQVRDAVGKTGWVQDNLIAKGATLEAVKSDKALIYDAPQDIKVTSASLAKGAIVAIVPDKTATGAFVKFVAYDEARDRVYSNRYLNSSDLTQQPDDVQAAITLIVLKQTKSADARKAILTSTANLVNSAVFGQEIQKQLDVLTPTTAPVAQAAAGDYIAQGDVQVYDQPDMMQGKVIGSLKQGDVVSVKEQSSSVYTVNGVQGRWLHLTQPDGWVFGGSLTAK